MDSAGKRATRFLNLLGRLIVARQYGVPVFLACILFFLVWPDFDLGVSRLFYDGETGTFPFSESLLGDIVYTGTHVVGALIFLIPATVIVGSFLSKRRFFVERRMAMFFLICAGILGPGLIVNTALKDHWGRPRPHQVVEFGGEKQYRPPFSPDFQNERGHSFVSGHASVGFYFFALALLARSRRWLWVPVFAGTAIGGVRIAQGAHFFSDVLFSGWVVWFSSVFLYAIFTRYGMNPGNVDRQLDRRRQAQA